MGVTEKSSELLDEERGKMFDYRARFSKSVDELSVFH
jgi:hypothetical protein